MKDAGPRISIVVPLFNEEANVSQLLARVFAVLDREDESWELICVDDGSDDETAARLSERTRGELRVIRKERNEGQHAAIRDGFRAARGEAVITLDADLQNPPEEIPRLLATLRAGHDYVGTVRVHRRDPLLRRLASRTLNAIARRVAGLRARDIGCMLRGYDARLATAIANDTSDTIFVPALAERLARKPIEIAVSHAERVAGESKYGIRDLLGLALRLRRTARLRG